MQNFIHLSRKSTVHWSAVYRRKIQMEYAPLLVATRSFSKKNNSQPQGITRPRIAIARTTHVHPCSRLPAAVGVDMNFSVLKLYRDSLRATYLLAGDVRFNKCMFVHTVRVCANANQLSKLHMQSPKGIMSRNLIRQGGFFVEDPTAQNVTFIGSQRNIHTPENRLHSIPLYSVQGE